MNTTYNKHYQTFMQYANNTDDERLKSLFIQQAKTAKKKDKALKHKLSIKFWEDMDAMVQANKEKQPPKRKRRRKKKVEDIDND